MIDYSKPTYIKAYPSTVQVWYHSPTGDSTDSLVANISCVDAVQSEMIAQQFAKAHDVVWYDIYDRPVSPEVTRLGSVVL